MTPAVRRSLQAGIIGCGVLTAAALWISVLAFVDRTAIVGWPLVALCAGLVLLLGGLVATEFFSRRSVNSRWSRRPPA